MKISSGTQYNAAAFQAKHRDIRKADDIVRNTNNYFKAFHPSWAALYYKTLDENNPKYEVQRDKFLDKLAFKFLTKVRYPGENAERTDKIPHSTSIELVEKHRLANCRECSNMILASMYANGYYDSKKAYLGYDYTLLDKADGRIITKGSNEIDHSCVISSMNNEKRKNNPNAFIVLDGWLGYATTASDMAQKYIGLFSSQLNSDIQKIAKKKNINLDNCIVRINPFYTTTKNKTDAQAIGQYYRAKYPGLLV